MLGGSRCPFALRRRGPCPDPGPGSGTGDFSECAYRRSHGAGGPDRAAGGNLSTAGVHGSHRDAFHRPSGSFHRPGTFRGDNTIAPEKTEPPQATTAPTSPIEAPPETEPTGGASSISLPYEIPDTGLVVAKVAAYDGIFLEDGSNEEITGVAAMVLTNTADTAVEFAGITLTAGTETWEFRASAIPAGATVVVQEANRTHFRETAYGDCKADVATLPELEMSSDQVEVTEHGGNSLTVTNLTGASIPVVRVFYKYYLEDMDAYVGGIAYTAKVENLEAGASVQITPTHYASGSSRVVMVRTYDGQ